MIILNSFQKMIKKFLMYKEKNLVIIHRETKIKEILPKIFTKISEEPHLVIFDSINGLYNTLSNDADSGRAVNSILMLLARNVTFSNSILIISALATKKENDWVLPNGRQILENENMKKFVISDRSKISIEK